jgi:hypothetical protein
MPTVLGRLRDEDAIIRELGENKERYEEEGAELRRRHEQLSEQLGLRVQEHRRGGVDDIHRVHISVGRYLLEEGPRHVAIVHPNRLERREHLPVSEGAELRDRASAVEGKLHQVELDSIQDYVAESDNLVSLQEQIRGCDSILAKMESLLGGFQADLGKISSEVRLAALVRAELTLRLADKDTAGAELEYEPEVAQP